MKFSPEYYSALESRIPTGGLRTRFAPSPTGFMHLGGLRTALYAYLLAKKAGGTFILRIEDTDQERFIPGAAELIYDTLKQAGLTYDEGPDVGGLVGPYIQSERREIYYAYIELLIAQGDAYLCFCEKDVLDEQRNINRASRIPHKYDRRCMRLSKEEVAAKVAAGEPYVVRQKMPMEGTAFFDDLVYGRIEMENATLDDQVLLKRDGMPTYNLANVVDDHLMGITHIIRGNEFVSSTPKYVLLYEAFGWTAPQFIHCAPIMRDATHKLSKRDGDAYFSDFVEKGYLVDAILNYIALLGWGPGGKEEKFTLPELVEAFDIKGLSKDPSIFDYKKLHSLNGMYLRAMSDAEFHKAALPYIKQCVKREIDTVYVARVLKERCEVLSEIPEQLDFIDEQPAYSPELYDNKKMKTTPESAKVALVEIVSVLEGVSDWCSEVIQLELLRLVERLGLKNGHILWPLRVALSGKMFTPGGGIELCVILGKEESIRRLQKAIQMLDAFLAEQAELVEVFMESP
ncbi:MAG: glutamate--tRNA ligase, partial [Oscillospiraceae bacterium]|nr:glutamate--tRNA ligase [Oscillospiraceae bacterium]